MADLRVEVEIMKKDIEYIKAKVDSFDKGFSECFVRQVEFKPIQRLIYGCVGLILVAVVTAGIQLIIRGTM